MNNSLLLKANQTSFPLKNHPFLPPIKPPTSIKKSKPNLSFCNSSKEDKEPEPSPSEGDVQRQDLLAKIAMLQAQKLRLTDFLDERSAYLTQFAEDANAEFDEIGENALKGLDEAEARILQNIENRMQAFEEMAEENILEIEKNEQKLSDFENRIENDRNEGLFFKNLGQKTPTERANVKEEIEKLKELQREKAGSRLRRSIYIGLICVVAVTILNAAITSPELEWQKIATLSVILVALVAQFAYEQRISSVAEDTVEEDRGRKE